MADGAVAVTATPLPELAVPTQAEFESVCTDGEKPPFTTPRRIDFRSIGRLPLPKRNEPG